MEQNGKRQADDGARLPEAGVLRLLDAAANRAREALRVVEDYVRFVLDDAHLTAAIKGLRHRLTAALAAVPLPERLACRDTAADVGTAISLASERDRCDALDVLAANAARLAEALRSLEEFGKLVSGDLAAQIEQIRYQSYTLQKAAHTTAASLARLADARLYVLVDGGPDAESFLRGTQALLDAKVDILQLRDKTLDDRTLLERARALRSLCRGRPTLLVINDRPDIAALCDADGVHVGQEELSVKDARTIVGPRRLVGVSTHSIEQARRAVLEGADYVGVGPVFPSGTKQFSHFPGLELVRQVANEIRLPAFCIGGISAATIGEVLAAGGRRVAVGGAICQAAEPAVAVAELRRRLGTLTCDDR